jgi:hypothetical protein
VLEAVTIEPAEKILKTSLNATPAQAIYDVHDSDWHYVTAPREV